MALFATLTTATRAADLKAAAKVVTDARDAGAGSNRTNWSRTTDLLAAVLTAIATGTPVDVTALFVGSGGKVYHVAHRALSAATLRPYWSRVQVVALKGATYNGRTVEGETDTVKGTTVLICPVE